MHTSLSIRISLLVGGCRFRMTVWVQTTVTQLQCAIVFCCPTQPLHKPLILVQPNNQRTEGINVKSYKRGLKLCWLLSDTWCWHFCLWCQESAMLIAGWATLIAINRSPSQTCCQSTVRLCLALQVAASGLLVDLCRPPSWLLTDLRIELLGWVSCKPRIFFPSSGIADAWDTLNLLYKYNCTFSMAIPKDI